jgi:hypothetical protein
MLKLRGTVVSTSVLSGVTLANPHHFIRIDPPELTFTVRVKSVLPPLSGYTNGSLVSFSSRDQALYPTGMVQGATYDLVVLRKVERSWEPFELQARPKLISQPNGAANRSQPVQLDTNRAPGAAGSGR